MNNMNVHARQEQQLGAHDQSAIGRWLSLARRWQKRLNGLNQRLVGCQLTRPIPELIDRAGFDVDSLESRYAEGMPRFTGYCYYGVATTRSG